MRGNIPNGSECFEVISGVESWCVCLGVDIRTRKEYCKLYDAFINDYKKIKECIDENPRIMPLEKKKKGRPKNADTQAQE
ncbi:MAG: hypothetical protein H7831_06775 [Magnetococcus sp. WYHC-3]